MLELSQEEITAIYEKQSAGNELLNTGYGVFHAFSIIGDSIAEGRSDGTNNSNNNTLYEWDSGTFTEVSDLAGANTGSWSPSFANQYNTLTGKKVMISENANGGSEFFPNGDTNNWYTTGTLYGAMKTETDAMISEVGSAFKGFIIILGVNDARGSEDIGDIETGAVSLITRLNADYSNPNIFICNIGQEGS